MYHRTEQHTTKLINEVARELTKPLLFGLGVVRVEDVVHTLLSRK